MPNLVLGYDEGGYDGERSMDNEEKGTQLLAQPFDKSTEKLKQQGSSRGTLQTGK